MSKESSTKDTVIYSIHCLIGLLLMVGLGHLSPIAPSQFRFLHAGSISGSGDVIRQ